MINKEGKNTDGLTAYEVSCDSCSTGSEEYEAEDWNHLMEQMGGDGWVKSNKGGTWKHYCPDCKGG